MLIFWFISRGLGFVVPLIAFGSSLIANLIFNAAYGDGYYDVHKWPCGLAMFVATVLCWLIGRHVRSEKSRIVIDEETGHEFVLDFHPSDHSFFFIPVEYWSYILLSFSITLVWQEFAS